MGVGVCSSAYHMTLKYHTQMCTCSRAAAAAAASSPFA